MQSFFLFVDLAVVALCAAVGIVTYLLLRYRGSVHAASMREAFWRAAGVAGLVYAVSIVGLAMLTARDIHRADRFIPGPPRGVFQYNWMFVMESGIAIGSMVAVPAFFIVWAYLFFKKLLWKER
jgi:hypothetical protein